MIRASLRGAALAAALALVPALASAQPVITDVSPSMGSGNTGATVVVTGTGFGAMDDRVYFPGTANYVTPSSASAGSVTCRVPNTWSGNVQVQSHGAGALSNGYPHEIGFTYHGTKWASGTRTWYLNSAGSPACSFNDTRDAIVAGFTTWSCASGVAPDYGGSTALNASDVNDGYNVQCFYTSGWADANIIANTGWRISVSTGDMLEFDIGYNAVHYTWSCYAAPGAMDIEDIATHEEGHAIGLGDLYGTADVAKTMYGYSVNGEIVKSTLALLDVPGAEWLYPHASRADLTSGTPAGWYAPLVPRNSDDATPSSAALPATLNGNATSYLNAAMINAGGDCASPWSNNLLSLDDVPEWNLSWYGSWGSGQLWGPWNNYAVAVRGGRHTLKVTYDSNLDIFESNEVNNDWQGQYVWSPYALANETPLYRPVPPDVGDGIANCDGLAFTGGWWGLVAIQPTAVNDDYDLRLFNDYTGSTAGFMTSLEGSGYGPGQSDFVLVNGNMVGYGATRWMGVTRYFTGSAADYLVSASSTNVTYTTPASYGATTSITDTIVANQIALVYEVRLDSTNVKYRFRLHNLAGAADLNLSLYNRTGTYFGKNDYLAAAMAMGSGTDEEFEFQPASAGDYALVVWKRGYADAGQANRYVLEIGPALGNLAADVTPAHWDSPIVPRDAAGATPDTAAVTPSLEGNISSTYYSWSTHLTSWVTTPTWRSMLSLDGQPLMYYDIALRGDLPVSAVDVGPQLVRGGRHTISSAADYLGAVAESNEGDNLWSGQWVWSPLPLGLNAPLTRSLPPDRGTFAQPNSDGFQFARTHTNTAWVVSLAGMNGADDYDLQCYDDYSGSTAGFSNLRAYSKQGSNATDFVVGHYSGTPTILYPAAVRYSTSGGGGSFHADATDAVAHNGYNPGGPVEFKNQVLGEGRLADVYEGYFYAGITYHLGLLKQPDDCDLAFEVFPGTPGGIYGRGQYLGVSTPVSAVLDTLAFNSTASGWYPIVVYRMTGSFSRGLLYEFNWTESSIVSVPGEELPAAIAFAGATPNPVVERARFTFALPRPETVRLRLFDLNGRLVRTLVDGRFEAGRHEVPWDGAGRDGARLGAGLFWARFEAGGQVFTKRVTVLR